MSAKDIAMHLMKYKPTPPPTHGLRIKTKKCTTPKPLPFLAYEYRDEDGNLIVEDYSASAYHVLMHTDPKRHYYNVQDALRYSTADIFELLSPDDPSITRIFFKNKFAVLPHHAYQYMRLSGSKARRAIRLGWHVTCEKLRNYEYF